MNKTAENKAPILITGGTGYLGSHMAALCLENNMDFVVLDNLSNSDTSNLRKLEAHFKKSIPFFNIDLRDKKKLNDFFGQHQFNTVIHFAGLKSVSESVTNPELYFENNVIGSENLIECVKMSKVNKVVFSSSATVYGQPAYLPIDEAHPVQPTNPYGETKAAIEKLFLNDAFFSEISVHMLRYFNPVGSYKRIIGESPKGVPNNLVPYILGVAKGQYEYLSIFGDDYDTKDGSGVRDYIHVMDLIEAHLHALKMSTSGCHIYNVGCGEGYSVKEVIKVFEEAHNISITFKIKPRRPGDIAAAYAKVDRIKQDYGWVAKRSLSDMCKDAWFRKSEIYEA